jgi:hypothetical protein
MDNRQWQPLGVRIREKMLLGAPGIPGGIFLLYSKPHTKRASDVLLQGYHVS